jgi:hypothetical protein
MNLAKMAFHKQNPLGIMFSTGAMINMYFKQNLIIYHIGSRR